MPRPLKIFLDDERPCPEGWISARWPEEVIAHLQGPDPVEALSLDHDLGDDARGTGYDVLIWLEEAVLTRGLRPPPDIRIHSANAGARPKMLAALHSIRRHSL